MVWQPDGSGKIIKGQMRREPQLLAKEKRWMDGQQMLQVAHQFLMEGEAPASNMLWLTSWITSPRDSSLWTFNALNLAFNCAGAAVYDRLQQLDESSRPTHEGGVGHLADRRRRRLHVWMVWASRPGALISLCHPGYQVRLRSSYSAANAPDYIVGRGHAHTSVC